MATVDEKNKDQVEVSMPDVEQKPRATAGKWLIWFIIIFAVVLVLGFIF